MRNQACTSIIAPLLLFLGLLMTGSLSLANPAEPQILYIHVRPPVSASCDMPPVTHCSAINRSTTLEGPLEFDLFYSDVWPGYTVRRVVLDLAWSESWELLGLETCSDATASVVTDGNRAALDLTWSDCPTRQESLLPLGRVLLNVSGYGGLGGVCRFSSTCDTLLEPYYCTVLSAEAGPHCGRPPSACNQMGFCVPRELPDSIHIDVRAGMTRRVEVPFSGEYMITPCAYRVTDHEAWHVSRVDHIDDWSYTLTVTVDAADLTQRAYESWIEIAATDESLSTCVPIQLTVLAPGSEQPAQRLSWGRVKTLYR